MSPGARFCHRCGLAAGAPAAAAAGSGPIRKETAPWAVAVAAVVLAIAAIIYAVTRNGSGPTVPDMANAGNTPAAAGDAAGAGAAPDISQMTPRQRFDALFNRIMNAASNGDTSTVVTFTPMGLAAYGMLPPADLDADTRYHAALLHAQVGDFPAAKAIADTILQHDPNHLFGYMIRGEVARLTDDGPGLAQAQRDFMRAYDDEMKARRVEYQDHRPVLDEFHRLAAQATRAAPAGTARP
ncbi:MAG: hypothetical protein ACOY71_13910 [Gemmatimonadota bacterium]